MKKGKYGLTYVFYASVAIIFAILNQTLLSILLLGFLIIVEQDEWTVRQSLQASAMVFLKDILQEVRYLIEKPGDWIGGFSIEGFYKLHNTYDSIIKIIYDFATICILVMLIVGLMRVLKSQDANLPFVSKFVDWAYGIVAPKPAPAPAAAPVQTQAPIQNQAPVQTQAPAQNQAPVQAQAPSQAPKADLTKKDDAKPAGKKFCTKCGTEVTGAFCTKCGNKIN